MNIRPKRISTPDREVMPNDEPTLFESTRLSRSTLIIANQGTSGIPCAVVPMGHGTIAIRSTTNHVRR